MTEQQFQKAKSLRDSIDNCNEFLKDISSWISKKHGSVAHHESLVKLSATFKVLLQTILHDAWGKWFSTKFLFKIQNDQDEKDLIEGIARVVEDYKLKCEEQLKHL